MANGIRNCAIEACCAKGSREQRAALIQEVQQGTGLEGPYCEQVADWLNREFDLMPAGTTKGLKDAIIAVWENRHPHP